MYKQTETQKTARLKSDVEVHPVATLKDEHGGVVHIWINDNCYIVGKEYRELGNSYYRPMTIYVKPTPYIFPEVLEVIKTLPPLNNKKENSNVSTDKLILFKIKYIGYGLALAYSNIKQGLLRKTVVSDRGVFVKINEDWYEEENVVVLAEL